MEVEFAPKSPLWTEQSVHLWVQGVRVLCLGGGAQSSDWAGQGGILVVLGGFLVVLGSLLAPDKHSRAPCKTFNSPTHACTSVALFLQDRQQFLLTYLSDEGIESSV